MTTVTIDVDVSSILEELLDDDLIEELEDRGGYVVAKELVEDETLDYEDLDYLLQRVDDTNNDGRRVYEKLRKMRFGQ